MNNLARNIIIWLVFGAALMGLFNMFQSPSTGAPSESVAYSDFMGQVKSNQIEEVLIDGRNLRGKAGTGRVVTTVMPPSTDVVKVLDENDVRIVATPEDSGMPNFFSILSLVLDSGVSIPIILTRSFFCHMPKPRSTSTSTVSPSMTLTTFAL